MKSSISAKLGMFPTVNTLRSTLVVFLTLLAFGLYVPSPSYAATLMVCASGCTYTTIAAAIAAASAGDTIRIQDADHLETGIIIDRNITIQGQSAATTIVDGGYSWNNAIFTVDAGVTATIQDMTLQKEVVGISNSGTLAVSNTAISGIFDAAIYNDGTLTVSNSTISGNGGDEFTNGGIYNAGTLTVSNSTISGNFALYADGAGIYNSGALTVSDSTISGNNFIPDDPCCGGGIANEGGTATVSNSTISGNGLLYSWGACGGIYNRSGGITIKNSIVAANTGDCCGTISALGDNLDTDGSCSVFTQVTSAQLNLGELALNAPGTTETLALLTGSVAIDAVTDCTDVAGNPVTTDQRGVSRPQGLACDIGSYELIQSVPTRMALVAGVALRPATGGFLLDSRFVLGKQSNGINPLTDPVTLQIGSYSTIIPAGSFSQPTTGAYVFRGKIGGVAVQVHIVDLAAGRSFSLTVQGSGANLSGITNPVKITLTIGDDFGSEKVKAKLS